MNAHNIGKERWDVLKELGLLDTVLQRVDERQSSGNRRVVADVADVERVFRQILARPRAQGKGGAGQGKAVDDGDWERGRDRDREERIGPRQLLGQIGSIAIVAFVLIYGLQTFDIQLGEMRRLYESVIGSGTDCDAVEEWLDKSDEWGDGSYSANRVPVPFRAEDYRLMERRMLHLRADVLASNPPEDAQALSAETAAFYDGMADFADAMYAGDVTAGQRLRREAERSFARIEAMTAELEESCT